MIQISTVADEQSTLVLLITFKDEQGADAVPTSATWTLTDQDGIVINSREDVAISPIAATVKIVLTGTDLALAIHAASKYKRYVTISAIYDSSAGSGLALTQQIEFYVSSNVAIT